MLLIVSIRATAAAAASGMGLPAKVAIGVVLSMAVLGAILGPSIYFGLAGKLNLLLTESRHVDQGVRFNRIFQHHIRDPMNVF